jgi:hypothetical protein
MLDAISTSNKPNCFLKVSEERVDYFSENYILPNQMILPGMPLSLSEEDRNKMYSILGVKPRCRKV